MRKLSLFSDFKGFLLILIAFFMLDIASGQFQEPTNVSLPGLSNSSVAWGDYDNDGYLDILLTGKDGNNQIVSKIFKNNKDGRFTEQIGINLAGVYYSSASWADYNNDGYLDILLLGAPTSKIYKNNGDGTFTDQTGITFPSIFNGSSAWGDYNNDGYLDLLITGYDATPAYYSKIYKNNGDGTFTEQKGISLTAVGYSSAAWGDYDNDGYLDILLTGYNGSAGISKIYKNNGDGTFTEQTAILLKGVKFSSAAWGDYNNDGYLDILLTGDSGSGGVSIVYKNNGNGTFTEQTGISLTGVASGSVAWGDYNNDGFLDIFLSGTASSGNVSKIYKNNGDGTFFEQTNISLVGIFGGSAAWGDYNNDGDLDILLSGSNISKLYTNTNAQKNTAPTMPTNLLSNTNQQSVFLSWDKSTDTETAQKTLTYNIKVGKTKNGGEIISPMSNINGERQKVANGNTGFNNFYKLNAMPDGKYYWGVQAIDNGYKGSSFSQVDSFTVVATTPTLQAQGIGFSNILAKQVRAGWNKGNGLKRAVFFKKGNSGNVLPVDGKTYSASPVFTQGSQIGTSGWYCVYNDTGTYVNITGLTTDTEYLLMVIEYNGIPGNEKYLTSISTNNPNVIRTKLAFFSPITHNYNPGKRENVSMQLGDFDNDNKLDLLVAAYDTTVGIYRNVLDTGFVKVETKKTKYFQPKAFWIDYNNDGYLDFADNSGFVYKNISGISFSPQLDIRNMDYTYWDNPWVDIDNDGDQDLFIDSLYYRNGSNNVFTPVQTGIPRLKFITNRCFGDFNNDGRTDILYSGASDNNLGNCIIYIYISNDDGTFTKKFEYKVPGYNQYVKAYWEDLDNDGDLDLILIGFMYEGGNSVNMKVLENLGNYNFTIRFSQPSTSAGSSETAFCIDYNNDGYMDIFHNVLYKNKGNFNFEEQTDEVINGNGFGWGDYDNDGDIDFISTTTIYRNNNSVKNTLPTAPSGLKSKISGNNVILNWSPATDKETPIKGLSYNLAINQIAGNAGSPFNISPLADMKTGYRHIVGKGNVQNDTCWVIKNLPIGTYSAQVQAIDFVYAGGPFSSEALFSILAIPQVQATNIIVSNITESQADISWINGNGDKRAVFIKYNTSSLAYPINNITYTANSKFAAGTQIETNGWFCVYNGTDNKVTVTGLASGHDYRVMVCEYSGSSGKELYSSSQAQGNPISFKTLGANAVNNLETSKILIYPNPARNYIIVSFEKLEHVQLTLTNLCGRVISSKQLYTDKEVVNVGSYPKGIYILKLQNEEGIKVTKLIIE